jgi:polyphosphate:AMP phosphotransferase
MLEKIDLSRKIPKDTYKKTVDELELRLGALQRDARERGIPLIVVFEGWDAAGKGTLINRLLLALDPRGFSVHPINPPNQEERMRPFLWRFWTKTPERGRIAIFDRSWYGRVLVERVEKIVKKRLWSHAYNEIRSFERQLADDGCVIVKFFLHIAKKEQKKRFRKLQRDPTTAWKVDKGDWKRHKKYGKYLLAVEDMLSKTDTAHGPWTIVEAHDRRFAAVKVFATVVEALERKIRQVDAGVPEVSVPPEPDGAAASVNVSSSILDQMDFSPSLTRKEYDEQRDTYQQKVREIEHRVFLKRLPVMIVYEGCDAAGKGGNIKRLVRGMDPRGYEVIPIAAPRDVEKAHHYLWRFWREIPKAGHIAIFDRSWYGRVLVERVEGFCDEADWRRAYREINEMEDQFVRFGGTLIKFWLQITPDEQLRRFEERQGSENKQWKITEEDWRNREKSDQYKAAVDEMLYRTSTSYAPWTLIEANCKWFARIKALRTVVEQIDRRLDG